MVKISTSILTKPKIDTIMKLNLTMTDYVHIDVMDGKFVSNKAFSISDINDINTYTRKPLDVHLMVNDINAYLEALTLSNVSMVTVHYEVLKDENFIKEVKNNGIKFGLSVKPNTEIDNLFHLLDKVDLILIMSVEPGEGGQKFLPESLLRIKRLKDEIRRRNLNVLVSVDGGINDTNANLCIEAGADILVVGTFILNSNDYQSQIVKLKR